MEQTIHHNHDKGYKYLFGMKRLFVQLLRCFVNQGWAQKIEPEDVELLDKSFILQDFKDKEADLVYKVKIDGDEFYFYLLELQSSVDFQMPYRLLLYMVEIWRTILKNTDSKEAERKDFKLPVIIPCVLYNGIDNWTVARSFRETLDRESEFGEFVLDFKYLLFDIKRYSDEELLELSNVIGTAFFIDKTRDKGQELLKRVEIAARKARELSDDDLGAFWNWLKNIAARNWMKDKEKEKELDELFWKERKVENMVYAIERVMQQEKMESFAEGEAKGKAEGKAEGRVEIAKEMLKEGDSFEKIARVTKLPLSTIQKLAKEIDLSAE